MALGNGRGGRDGRHLLVHREGFARERGFVALERVGLEQARIGGDPVAGIEQHDVAADEVARADRRVTPIAYDGHRRREHLFERVERALGLVLLQIAEQRAEQHDGEDDGRVHDLAEGGRQRRGDEQDDDEGVLELPDEELQPRGRRARRERIRAVTSEPPRRLAVRESTSGVRVQRSEHRACRHRVPVRRQGHLAGACARVPGQRARSVASPAPTPAGFPIRSTTDG